MTNVSVHFPSKSNPIYTDLHGFLRKIWMAIMAQGACFFFRGAPHAILAVNGVNLFPGTSLHHHQGEFLCRVRLDRWWWWWWWWKEGGGSNGSIKGSEVRPAMCLGMAGLVFKEASRNAG